MKYPKQFLRVLFSISLLITKRVPGNEMQINGVISNFKDIFDI